MNSIHSKTNLAAMCLLICAFAIIPATLHATGVVGWNYDRYGTVSGTRIAGVVPAENWNNSWPSNPTIDLISAAGNATTVDITYSSTGGGWSIVSANPGQDSDGTYNREMINGYLNSNGPTTVTISQIPYSGYSIYAYFSADAAGRTGLVTIDDVTSYSFTTIGNPSVAGTTAILTQTTDTSGGYPDANYAVFAGLTGTSQTISCNVPAYGGIAAFQLVSDDLTPPAAPTGLTATAGDNSVALDWADNADSDLASYTVYRSTTSGDGSTSGVAIATGLTTSDYTDDTAVNGMTYYYVVTAIDVSDNESADSAEAGATLALQTAGVVSWNLNNWGDTPPAEAAGVVPVANWNDSWLDGRTVDLLNANGDATTVDIAPASNSGTWAIAFAHAGADADGTYNREMINGYLNSTGISSVAITQIPFAEYSIYAYVSSDAAGRVGLVTVDGITSYSFTAIGGPSIAGTNAILTRTTDTAGGYPAANYAIFTGLSGTSQTITCNFPLAGEYGGIAGFQLVSSDITPPSAPAGLTATAGDGSIALGWTHNAEADWASYTVYRSTTSGSGYSAIATGVTTNSYTDDTTVNAVSYYYVVTATDTSLNESDDSAEVVAISPVNTPVVSWNLDSNGTVPPAGTAGVVPVANWNDSWLDGRTANLVDSHGNATTLDIASSASPWNYNVVGSHPGRDSDGTYNKEIINGYLNAGSSYSIPVSSVAITQIPYGQYNIIAYFSSDTAGRTGTISLDGVTTYSFSAVGGPSVSGTNAVLALTTDTASGNPSANYAIFSGLTGASHTIVCNVPDWGGLAAFQVVSTDATPPAAPTGLTATAGESSVALDWADNAESDLASYTVYRSTTSGDGSTTGIAIATGLSTSEYTDTTAVNGTPYYYVVTASDYSYNESADSAEDSATPSNMWPPAAPAGLSALAGDNTVALNWADNTEPDLASYTVYRSTTSGSGYAAISTGVLTSEYTDNTAVNGMTYYYVVTATDTADNESANSAQVGATPGDTTPPAAPTGLSATAGNGSVALDWADNTEPDLASYTVYRSTMSGSGYASIGSSVTSDYTDDTAVNGMTYYYVVTAVDSGTNESANSSEVSATPELGIYTISWNQEEGGSAVVDEAGVVLAGNWNNNTATDLIDQYGTTSTVDIVAASWDVWNIIGGSGGTDPGADADGSNNKRMLNSYLNSGDAQTPTTSSVVITEIPFDQYIIIVYVSSDAAGRTGTVTVGAQTFSFTTIGGPSVSGDNAVLTRTMDSGAGYPAANYAVFGGLSGDTQTINCYVPQFGGIAAFQIVPVNTLPDDNENVTTSTRNPWILYQ